MWNESKYLGFRSFLGGKTKHKNLERGIKGLG